MSGKEELVAPKHSEVIRTMPQSYIELTRFMEG